MHLALFSAFFGLSLTWQDDDPTARGGVNSDARPNISTGTAIAFVRAPAVTVRLLLAIIIWLMTSLAPAWAKNSVWLDDTTELRYSKGHYKADGRHLNGIDIDISDVDIFEKGIQRGFCRTADPENRRAGR